VANPALFDLDPGQVHEPTPVEEISAGRRRTIRQAEALRRGRHPLGLAVDVPLRLHADAPPPDDRTAPGPRCKTCRFREVLVAYSGKHYPKCVRGRDGKTPYVSHGAATDCRAWWPACIYWEPTP
jgi:hypothetical protein